EILKIRKLTWVSVIFGPLGGVAMQGANYALRFDYLMSRNPDKWLFLLENIHAYWPPSLLLGTTMINSLLAGMEHHANMWKKLFSPVSYTHL
ncbi:hypothetical protein FO492_22315, partial [Bacillus paralicheniformis]|nr:hypothetical protein [Bacillus paralicheniformis]